MRKIRRKNEKFQRSSPPLFVPRRAEAESVVSSFYPGMWEELLLDGRGWLAGGLESGFGEVQLVTDRVHH